MKIDLFQSCGHCESESEVAQLCPILCDPWTVAYQAPPSMGFSRQECWSGLPFPSPGDLPDPGIEPGSPALQADALLSEPLRKPIFQICWHTECNTLKHHLLGFEIAQLQFCHLHFLCS